MMRDGIKFTSKKILQWAVIILGFSLNLGTIAKMGGKVSCLIGVGSSICGGSAIAATAPVIEADDEEVAQAISVIFLFNVIAALIFPSFGHAIGFGSEGFAIFAGTAVNDTSSVTAVASTAEGLYGVEGILSSAVTVKLVRTLAIIPITLTLALYRITTIVGLLPKSTFTVFYTGTFVKAMKWLAKFFIAMAMCAIGLNTNLLGLIKKGGKPILMGFCCWSAITAVSITVQYALGMFYTNL